MKKVLLQQLKIRFIPSDKGIDSFNQLLPQKSSRLQCAVKLELVKDVYKQITKKIEFRIHFHASTCWVLIVNLELQLD